MKPWWLRLTRYAIPQTPLLGVVLLLMTIGIGLNLLTPWPMKLIVDSVLAGEPLPASAIWISHLPGGESSHGQLGWLSLATVVLFLASRVRGLLQTYLQAGAGSRMIYGLASDLFAHLQRQSLLFHGQRRSGDLVRRVTADSECVRDLVIGVYLPLVTSLVTLVAMFCVMWQLNRGLAICALLIAFPLGGTVKLFVKPMAERKYREKELQGELAALAEQTLTAIPLLKAFEREAHETSRYRALAAQAVRANLRAAWTSREFTVTTNGITAIANSLAMAAGGYYVLQGTLTVGSLLVLLTYFTALYSPLETLAYLSDGLASAAAGARRVLEVLDSDDDCVTEAPHAIHLRSTSHPESRRVRFEGVTFGYRPGQPVLHDISFDVEPGEVVAIVGPTGAGKSTLMSLLPRFFDPWHGSVLVDEQDIRMVKLAALRAQFAIVLQEPFLLPLTVAENIAYGRPVATRAEIVAAAEAANASIFIERLADGYDSVIGERGITLSGGEKQRLSIARALLKHAPIVILDEPSSSLDSSTESLVFDAIRRLTKDKTTFVIAHRLSTIRDADRLLVIENGRLTETGKPSELLAHGGYFQRVSKLQSLSGNA